MTSTVAARTWRVFDDNVPRFREMCLQEIGDGPGPLTSWAPPPPDGKPVLHPFLSAHTEVTNYESRLRRLLVQSTSLMDYLARLGQDGLRVEMVSPAQRWRVFRGERVAAEISNTPAFLSPAGPAVLADLSIDRQFLSLTTVSADDLDDLRQTLSQSENLAGFLHALKEAEYRVAALDE
jgi:hypothetical protein